VEGTYVEGRRQNELKKKKFCRCDDLFLKSRATKNVGRDCGCDAGTTDTILDFRLKN